MMNADAMGNVDPRRSRSDERIRRATLQLLREKGPQAVTVEGVAALSGVAKTTIYRRFSDRRQLVQAALDEITKVPTPAPEVPTREKIRWALESARETLEARLGLSSVAALLAAQDAEFTESARAVLVPHAEQMTVLLQSAVDAGNLRPGIDPETVLNLILGASLGEWLRFGRVRDEWLESTLDVLWTGIGST